MRSASLKMMAAWLAFAAMTSATTAVADDPSAHPAPRRHCGLSQHELERLIQTTAIDLVQIATNLGTLAALEGAAAGFGIINPRDNPAIAGFIDQIHGSGRGSFVAASAEISFVFVELGVTGIVFEPYAAAGEAYIGSINTPPLASSAFAAWQREAAILAERLVAAGVGGDIIDPSSGQESPIQRLMANLVILQAQHALSLNPATGAQQGNSAALALAVNEEMVAIARLAIMDLARGC
jgi:hypothetical protein